MPSEVRHHLNDYARRYRTAAAAGNWHDAKLNAILLRRYHADTDEQVAEALYAEGYAREKLSDARLAAACYALCVMLTRHEKATRRLEALDAL